MIASPFAAVPLRAELVNVLTNEVLPAKMSSKSTIGFTMDQKSTDPRKIGRQIFNRGALAHWMQELIFT